MGIRGSHALAATTFVALIGCSGVQPRPDLPAQVATPPGMGGLLDQLIAPAEERHPGQSGFRLVREGPEAFAIRSRSALVAQRTLDVQTYIWHADDTGAFLAWRLLEAADRGVKVRILVDDMDARGDDFSTAAFDAHPNIEVRLFNPFLARTGTLKYALEFLGNFDRANRRMHNKTWIADNRIAIVGGRNLGDEYFGASDEVNFVDLDFAMVGPIVRDASASFDRYWNSPASYPIAMLARPDEVTPENLDRLREWFRPRVALAEGSKFAQELRYSDAVQRLIAGDWPMYWAANGRFISDDPLKVLGQGSGLAGSQVLTLLAPGVLGAEHDLTIISPYFVPGRAGTDAFVGRAKAGTRVRVLTNSLAANDVAMVYGGYSEWREELVRGGVHIWELKPLAGVQAEASLFGSSGASLHTKALSVDGRLVFVGSYNLDARSASLNTEQGVFVESPEIAAQLEAIFAAESGPERAWEVTLRDEKLQWSDGSTVHEAAPLASGWRKFQAWVARILPIEKQL